MLVFAVVSVLLMTVDHRADHLNSLRDVLSTAVYPLRYVVDGPIQAGRWLGENLTMHRTLVSENADLRQRQLLLESRLERFDELVAENRRLRGLLESSYKVGEHVLIAELLAVDMDPFSRRIALNKGRQNGVAPGQSLVDANGVMGQIVHADRFSSTALLITDPSHALPVQVNRSGLRTIAVGTGSVNLLELMHIPNHADMRVGDTLITSGLGHRFPAGYPVGTVVRVERDSGEPFARVLVEPSAKLERNREVLLVWPQEYAHEEDEQ